jgi:hypothetical protein
MKKFIPLLWILMFISFFLGIMLGGNNFVKERAITLCLSCMGIEE